ncbi:MAG: T9SS type A sorting domain-containing protein, partial [Candidatus Cloacimonetes bacterium]|nr:T9SS type A sorting domain-containing protein [Candidatus Cloacimonadota bacterium]
YLNVNPSLALEAVTVNEANGNGFIEPGEFIDLNFTISNSGLMDAENVVANLTSNDANIGITIGTSSYEIVPGSDGTAVNTTPFMAMISPVAPNGSVIPLTLTLATEDDTWVINTSITVTTPYIGYSNAFICDYETGNGNGIPNLNESSVLIINIENPGLMPIMNVQTSLTCNNPNVTISGINQNLPFIPTLSSNQAVFSVHIDATVPNNTNLVFTFHAQGTGTQLMTETIDMTVGSIGTLTVAGVINGNVSVDTGAVDLENIVVSTGDFTCLPADTGVYKLYAPAGAYTVTGSLEHYAADFQNNVIISQAVHINNDVNLTLEYLAEATGLAGSFDARELTLIWTAPDSDFDVNGYNVYRKINNGQYVMLGYTETESYIDNIVEDGEYFYYVVTEYYEGISIPSVEFVFDTAVEIEEDVNPLVTELLGNYPNPFNPTTNIAYSLAVTGNVKIDIYNIRGQHVVTLTDEVQSAGKHVIQWNGKDANNNDCATGLYMYRFQTKGVNTIKKAMLLK